MVDVAESEQRYCSLFSLVVRRSIGSIVLLFPFMKPCLALGLTVIPLPTRIVNFSSFFSLGSPVGNETRRQSVGQVRRKLQVCIEWQRFDTLPFRRMSDPIR